MPNTDIFGQMSNLKSAAINCAIGNIVVKDVIDDFGKIRLDRLNKCTKSTLWYYVYYIWSFNKETFPFSEIKSKDTFLKDAITVLETYMQTKYRSREISRYFNKNSRLIYLTKQHLVSFINDTIGQLKKLRIPIIGGYVSKEEALLNLQLEDQHKTHTELIEAISNRISNPVIHKVKSRNKVTFARLSLSGDKRVNT